MKKSLITLALAVLAILPATAQMRGGSPQRRTAARTVVTAVPVVRTSHAAYNRVNDGCERYVGLRLGCAISSVYSDDSRLDGDGPKAGLNIGIVGGVQLTEYAPLYFEGGLLFTEKGGKASKGMSENYTYTLDYLEVPLVFKYKQYLDDFVSIEPFIGGFLACGIAGNMKDYDTRTAESSFSANNFQRFDGGIRFGVGASMSNFYLEAVYDLGLANICHDTFDQSHTSSFCLNIGVNF